MNNSEVILNEATLSGVIEQLHPDRIFVLVDTLTQKHCWPSMQEFSCLKNAHVICIENTDAHKNLETLEKVWTALSENGATRHSLLINLGGGMVTDLGGFAAACFKRGIAFVNIPTTLLSMVDAAKGGKTGINFNGLKNEIGCFYNPVAVLYHTAFLKTLDSQNLRSGFAEMLKHGLLSDRTTLANLVNLDINDIDNTHFQQLILKSVAVKNHIVDQDPHEKGLRKALNLGHTIGHAIESLTLEQGHPFLHGYCVAWGLMGALYLSVVKLDFPREILYQVGACIKATYGSCPITCKDYDALYAFTLHDKKNTDAELRFTLLEQVGSPKIDCIINKEELFEALDFCRDY